MITAEHKANIPKARTLTEFSQLAHGVKSSKVTILDSKRISIPNLSYDGAGPDAFFVVGTGAKPHGNGIKVANEKGR